MDGEIIVTGSSVKSQLHSVPDCQKIVKKAIVEKLKEIYSLEWFPETGANYTVKVRLLKDEVSITLDTSGVGLHKRGYRVSDVEAPIKETLASALVQLSFWKPGRLLVDPLCGSGTIPIEAAMLGKILLLDYPVILQQKSGMLFQRNYGRRKEKALRRLIMMRMFVL